MLRFYRETVSSTWNGGRNPASLDEVAKWCDGQANHDHPAFVQYRAGRDDETGFAYPGDVIVRLDGSYFDVPDWLFERDCASQWTEVTT